MIQILLQILNIIMFKTFERGSTRSIQCDCENEYESRYNIEIYVVEQGKQI